MMKCRNLKFRRNISVCEATVWARCARNHSERHHRMNENLQFICTHHFHRARQWISLFSCSSHNDRIRQRRRPLSFFHSQTWRVMHFPTIHLYSRSGWMGNKNYDSCDSVRCVRAKSFHFCQIFPLAVFVQRNFPFARTDGEHVNEPRTRIQCVVVYAIHIYLLRSLFLFKCIFAHTFFWCPFSIVAPAQRFPADTRDFIVALEL